MKHNIFKLVVASTSIATALSMTACGGNDNGEVAQDATGSDVPEGAGSSGPALVTYLLALMSSDETSEPSSIRDSFAVPPDETSDPQPLI